MYASLPRQARSKPQPTPTPKTSSASNTGVVVANAVVAKLNESALTEVDGDRRDDDEEQRAAMHIIEMLSDDDGLEDDDDVLRVVEIDDDDDDAVVLPNDIAAILEDIDRSLFVLIFGQVFLFVCFFFD